LCLDAAHFTLQPFLCCLWTKDDKVEMISRIESSKTDTIKWMFIFWMGQLAADTGILFALLNIYLKKII
jgi:hypothetical protein